MGGRNTPPGEAESTFSDGSVTKEWGCSTNETPPAAGKIKTPAWQKQPQPSSPSSSWHSKTQCIMPAVKSTTAAAAMKESSNPANGFIAINIAYKSSSAKAGSEPYSGRAREWPNN